MVFALIVRLHFFVGFSASYSLDEGVYINFADKVNSLDYRPTFGHKTENPIIVRRVRIGFLYPLHFFMKTIGRSNFSVGAFSLFCSIGLILVAFGIGKTLFNRETGLLAAFLASIFPLNVIYGTKVLPDIPIAFFMSLSVYFFIKSLKSENTHRLFYSISAGIAFGLGYLIKEMAVILFLFYGIIFIYFLFKKFQKAGFILLIAGFLIIFSLQNLYFYTETGELFYREKVTHKAHIFKTNSERSRNVLFNFQNRFKVLGAEGYNLFYFTNQLFGLSKENLNYSGYIPLFLLSLPFLLIFKRNKKVYFLFLWFLSLFLFLELGPSSISIENGAIIYIPIFKEISAYRFISPLILPMVLLISYFLMEGLRRNLKYKYAAVASLVFITITSFMFISHAYGWHYESKRDIVKASKFLKKYPDREIYTDRFAALQLSLYLKNKSRIRRIGEVRNFNKIKESFVVLGGTRGKGTNYNLYECCYPDDMPLKRWKKLKVIQGGKPHKKLKIYKVR